MYFGKIRQQCLPTMRRREKYQVFKEKKMSPARIELASDPCQGSILTDRLRGLVHLFNLFNYIRINKYNHGLKDINYKQ